MGRQERLWHGRSHHCVWNHAGSTSGYVTSTDLNDLLHLALLFHFVYEICASPGEALLESNTVIDFVYCSPSLRCVQTAQNILKGKKSLLEKIWIWDSSTFTLWLLNFLSLVCNRGLPRTYVIKMSCDESCLCKQVCSRTVSWRCEWNRGFLNGPSGFLGTLCLHGYLPLTWLQPTLVWTQHTGDKQLRAKYSEQWS